MDRKQTFQTLKSPCIELSRIALAFAQDGGPALGLLSALTQLLDTLREVTARPDSLDEKLADYVFFPLSHVLRASRTVPIRALELSLTCLSVLLCTAWRSHIASELAGQLLILITFLANPASAGKGIAATSEELQSTAFDCLRGLFAALSQSPEDRGSITATANIPALGEAALVILEGLTNGASHEIQLSSLHALEAMGTAIDDKDALASFLPRIVSSLTKALTLSNTNRRHYRLLEVGLDVLSSLLVAVLSDAHTKDLPQAATENEQRGDHAVHRTTSWLKATAAQIMLALANVIKLNRHQRNEVRRALLRLCLAVIEECRYSLSDSIGMMLDTLVALAGRDEEGSVEKTLQHLLLRDSTLVELLKSNLHNRVVSLPRIMQAPDDMVRRHAIHQITVTLHVLTEEKLGLAVIEPLLATNLRDSVLGILKDSRRVASVIDATSSDALLQSETWAVNNRLMSFPPLILGSQSQVEMATELETLLRRVAASSSSVLLTRDLFNLLYNEREEAQLASYWLLTQMLAESSSQAVHIDDFLDLGSSHSDIRTESLSELYSFSTSVLADPEPGQGPYMDWRFRALALEVVALQAQQYKADFRSELTDALYPVVHLVGSSNPALRKHAISCLNIISDSCGYRHASDLIVSNADYMVNAIALKLDSFDLTPQAPQVLLMMIRLCGPNLLPYLDDIVETIFSALEQFHGYPALVELLFAALKGIAEEGVKTPQLAITSKNEASAKTQHIKTEIGDIAQAIAALKISTVEEQEDKDTRSDFSRRPWGNEPASDSKVTGGMDTEREEDPRAEPSMDSPPPAQRTFDILLKISRLTQHYLTSASPSLRTSLLSLLNSTIPALSKHENSFLPLINTLWPVLVARLSDPEAYVVCNTLDIISLTCSYAGDFMRGRIEAVWLDLVAIYRRTLSFSRRSQVFTTAGETDPSMSRMSRRTTESSLLPFMSELPSEQTEYYVHAPARLIWDSLVKVLSKVAAHLSIDEEIYDDILDMLDPVLEIDDIKQALEIRNADAVWLRILRKSSQRTRSSEAIDDSASKFRTPIGKCTWQFVPLPVQ